MKILILIFSLFLIHSFAQDLGKKDELSETEVLTDNLYTYPIKGSIEANRKTSYSKFLDHIVEHSKKQKIKNYPYKRSVYNFLKDKNSCLFPASKIQFKDVKTDIIYSNSLIDININVLSLEGRPVANTIEDLNNKVIISLNQVYVPEVIKGHAKRVVTVEYEDQAIKMLQTGRADYLLAPGSDLMKLYSNEGVKLSFNENFIVATFFDRIACHNIKKNKKLIEVFNKMIK